MRLCTEAMHRGNARHCTEAMRGIARGFAHKRLDGSKKRSLLLLADERGIRIQLKNASS